MGGLVVRENKLEIINKRLDDRQLQKKALLEQEIVQWKLSENDMMIAQAGVSDEIRNIDDDILIKKVATITKWICRDIGVRDWDNPATMKYDATRFLTTIKKHYKDFTIKEINMAFELLMVGELDEWLPKDKRGEPDRNHYNSFNLNFYTKVLNAYRSKKASVWRKAKNCLPKFEEVVSEEQKLEYRKAFINDIYDAFDKYKKDGINPKFILSIFINEFIKQKVINNKPKPSRKTVERAYKNILLGNMSRIDKNSVKQDFHKNKIDGILLRDAETIENNLAIKKTFDNLISNNLDIREVIKTES